MITPTVHEIIFKKLTFITKLIKYVMYVFEEEFLKSPRRLP